MSDPDLTDPAVQADRVDPIPDDPKDVFVKIDSTEYDTETLSLPTDRVFREAWEAPENGAIAVNMDKAKDVWRDKIRLARPDEFTKLDADFMKALETGSDTSTIAAQKQALRDAPQHADIDAATTPDELKLVQPIPNVTVG